MTDPCVLPVSPPSNSLSPRTSKQAKASLKLSTISAVKAMACVGEEERRTNSGAEAGLEAGRVNNKIRRVELRRTSEADTTRHDAWRAPKATTVGTHTCAAAAVLAGRRAYRPSRSRAAAARGGGLVVTAREDAGGLVGVAPPARAAVLRAAPSPGTAAAGSGRCGQATPAAPLDATDAAVARLCVTPHQHRHHTPPTRRHAPRRLGAPRRPSRRPAPDRRRRVRSAAACARRTQPPPPAQAAHKGRRCRGGTGTHPHCAVAAHSARLRCRCGVCALARPQAPHPVSHYPRAQPPHTQPARAQPARQLTVGKNAAALAARASRDGFPGAA